MLFFTALSSQRKSVTISVKTAFLDKYRVPPFLERSRQISQSKFGQELAVYEQSIDCGLKLRCF